jgi:hypothetical protein
MTAYDDGKIIVKVTLSIVFLIVVIGYGVFQSNRIMTGPKIDITNVENGIATTSPLFTIDGNAQNTSILEINGRQVFTDEKGYFAEKILLYPGYNVISLQAKDKFGAVVTKTVDVVYENTKTI